MRFYIDTCVWRDLFEMRTDTNGRQLGLDALDFLRSSLEQQHTIIVSELVFLEFGSTYDPEAIERVFGVLRQKGTLEIVQITTHLAEAQALAEKRNVPMNDVLHAMTARDSQAVLVTQDRHFKRLTDIVEIRGPNAFKTKTI